MEQQVSYTLDSTWIRWTMRKKAPPASPPNWGFGEDEVMQISMAVREGAVNASCTATNTRRIKK